MKPRAIGIVAGGGGPISAASILRDIIFECQRKYSSSRSHEFPCINFYSYPYSEMLLVHNSCSIPSRELSFCIQQLKLIGMEIIVIPCFTMSSFLTYRNFGLELIEMGSLMGEYLERNRIKNPLVICAPRARKSGYCDKHFKCHYPSEQLQNEVNLLIEEAVRGKRIDMRPLFSKLPDVPIICAMGTLNAQAIPFDDPRWINPNQILVEYVVHRSYEGSFEDKPDEFHSGFIESQRDAVSMAP